MKSKMLFTALLALAPAWAQAFWEPFYVSGVETATIQYGGKAASVNENSALYGPLAQLDSRLAGYYGQVQSQLDAIVSQKIAEAGASFGRGGFTGDLSLSFQGGTSANPNLISLTLSGPTYWASGTISKSTLGGLISGSCTATLKFSNVRLSAMYDITTGQSVQVTAADLHPTQDVSCSTSLDWFPILGNLVSNYIEGLANDKISAAVNTFVTNLTTAGPGIQLPYFGLPSTIGYGQYVIDGFDAGAYLKNNFMNLFIGQSVTMTLSDPKVFTILSDTPAVFVNRNYQRLRVDFSGASTTLSLSLAEARHYKYVWKCPPKGPSCQEP